MNRIACPHETIVSEAARSGCWNDAAKSHMQQCAVCREVAEVTGWMGRVAVPDARGEEIPGPERVYLYAKINAMQEAKARALRALNVTESIIRIVIVLAMAGGIIGLWFACRSLASNVISSYPRVPEPVFISLSALVGGLIALLFAKLVEPVLLEE